MNRPGFLTVLLCSCLVSSYFSIRVLNDFSKQIRKPAAFFTAATILSTLIVEKGYAIGDTSHPVLISGSIKLSKDIFKDADPTFNSKSAVYATIRQDLGTWTSAVRNIKAPPVLSKRIALTDLDPTKQLNEIFPMKVIVESTVDSTAEGLALLKDWSSGIYYLIRASFIYYMKVEFFFVSRCSHICICFWFYTHINITGRTPLTVSVRLDDDGVASTRSPSDLVGQTSVSKNQGTEVMRFFV